MRARLSALSFTPLPAERSAVPTAWSTWAAVRPWQAGGSAVTVTCCLIADSPNWVHDPTEACEVAGWLEHPAAQSAARTSPAIASDAADRLPRARMACLTLPSSPHQRVA